MDHFEAFLRAEHAGEIMIAAGALLALFGAWRILKSSLTLIFWVALSGLGVASVAYGMQSAAIALPGVPSPARQFSEPLNQGAELSADVLRVLCARLAAYGAE